MSAIVNISPIWNDAQFFDEYGHPLSGGKIYTYDSSANNAITYADSTGTVANSNPIILDSNGRLQTSIWLVAGQVYTLVLGYGDPETGFTEIKRVEGIITPRIIAGTGINITGNGTGDVTISAPGASDVAVSNGLGQSYEFWLTSNNPMMSDGNDYWDFSVATKVPTPFPTIPDVSIIDGNLEVITFTVSGAYSVVVNAEINPDPTGLGDFWPAGTTVFGSKIYNPDNSGDNVYNKSYHTKYSFGSGDGFNHDYQSVSWTDNFTVSVEAGVSIQFSTYWLNNQSTSHTGGLNVSLIITRIGDKYDSALPGA